MTTYSANSTTARYLARPFYWLARLLMLTLLLGGGSAYAAICVSSSLSGNWDNASIWNCSGAVRVLSLIHISEPTRH